MLIPMNLACPLSYNYGTMPARETLCLAAMDGNARMVSVMMECGFREDIDIALMFASMHCHVHIVQMLIEHGAATYPALRKVADPAIARMLLEASGPHAREFATRALKYAAWDGRARVMRVLLDAGADVRSVGGQPLYVAVWAGHAHIVRMLLDAGADPHDSDDLAPIIARLYGRADLLTMLGFTS